MRRTKSGPGDRGKQIAALLSLPLFAGSVAACNPTSTIEVRKDAQMQVQVLDTQGNPLTGLNTGYFVTDFKVNTPATTPPTPYTTAGSLEVAAAMGITDDEGNIQFFFPRGDTPSSNIGDVISVETNWGHLYSLVLNNQFTVDMVSTVVYEYLAYYPIPINTFTLTQLQTLTTLAYQQINSAIANHWIDPTQPMEQLHRAYQNALAGYSNPFVTTFLNMALVSAGIDMNAYAAFQLINTPPKMTSESPTQQGLTLMETSIENVSYSAMDADGDVLFYSWISSPTPLTPYTLSQGTLLNSKTQYNGSMAYEFSSDYNTVQWWQVQSSMYLYAVVSDGSPAVVFQWGFTIQNKERQPTFTSTAPNTATEDSLWNYTAGAVSPDGAPVILSLVTPLTVPNIDMCIPSAFYMTNPPAQYIAYPAPPNGYSPLSTTPPTWQWQIAGTPCLPSQQYQIAWTPNNCVSGPILSPVTIPISAVDITGSGSTQNAVVTVADVNTPPVITSTPSVLSITGPTAWTYSPVVSDPQLTLNTPGAYGCIDVMSYKMISGPNNAVISPTGGTVTWTPLGKQVGPNAFEIEVDDMHGGSYQQSWTVDVSDVNVAPTIVGTCQTTAHEAGTPQGVPPNQYNYVCSLGLQQWTANSNFNVSITGMPSDANQFPPASEWWDSSGDIEGSTFTTGTGGSFGIYWNVTDADTIPHPAVTSFPISIQLCNDGENNEFAHMCSTYSFTLNAPKEDLPPQWYSNPPVSIMGGCGSLANCQGPASSTYTYNAVVTDGNTSPPDTFTYALTQPSPAGTSPATGTVVSATAPTGQYQINWPVGNTGSDLGAHTFSLTATSGLVANGGPTGVKQSLNVIVLETNYTPTIAALPAQTATNGSLYTVNFGSTCSTAAVTFPNKTLTYTLAPGYPTGMAINSTTGVLTWTPTATQALSATPIPYSVICASTHGTPPTQAQANVSVTMSWSDLSPVWTTVNPQVVGVGDLLSFPLQAYDPDGNPVTISMTSSLQTGMNFNSNGGNGSFTWTPTQSQAGSYTLTFKAVEVGGAGYSSTMSVKIQVATAPVVVSNPVLYAKMTYPYHYEMHAIDPVGKGLQFSVDNSSPIGVTITPLTGSNTAATVEWTPALSDFGNQTLQIDILDGDSNQVTSTWNVSVLSGTNSPPVITGTNPAGSPVIATEGYSLPYSPIAVDPDGDKLHFDYYWDGNWISDSNISPVVPYAYAPLATASGNHIMTMAVTDGASADVTTTINVHVRDAIPEIGSTYSTSGATITGLLVNSKSANVFTMTTSPAALDAFNESSISAGPASSSTLPYNMHRMALNANFPNSSQYLLYFASLSDILGGSINYATVDSTNTMTQCTAATCQAPTFLTGYTYSGGTQNAYVASNQTSYYIKSTNHALLGTYVSGVASADINLGTGVSANALVLDPTTGNLYVSDGGNNQLIVLNPSTNAIVTTLSGVGHNPSPLIVNAAEAKLYVYSPVDGTISEITTSTNNINFTTTGLPTSSVIGYAPNNVFVENTNDDVIYLAVPDKNILAVYDVQNNGINEITLSKGPDELAVDNTSGTVYTAIFSTATLFQER